MSGEISLRVTTDTNTMFMHSVVMNICHILYMYILKPNITSYYVTSLYVTTAELIMCSCISLHFYQSV